MKTNYKVGDLVEALEDTLWFKKGDVLKVKYPMGLLLIKVEKCPQLIEIRIVKPHKEPKK